MSRRRDSRGRLAHRATHELGPYREEPQERDPTRAPAPPVAPSREAAPSPLPVVAEPSAARPEPSVLQLVELRQEERIRADLVERPAGLFGI